MFMWVAAEADGTRRTMVFLISCLVGIAVLLTGLTIWYWLMTRPDDDDESDDDVVDDLPRTDVGLAGPGRRPPVDDGASSIGMFDFTTMPDGVDALPVPAPEGEPAPDSPLVPEPVSLDLTAAAASVEVVPAPPEMPMPVGETADTARTDGDPVDEVDLVAVDRDLVAETGEGGQELTDDGWDALRRSVFDKFQR